jgi:hypothetical protein
MQNNKLPEDLQQRRDEYREFIRHPRAPMGPITVDRAPSGIVQFFCNDAIGRLCMFDVQTNEWVMFHDAPQSSTWEFLPVLPLSDFFDGSEYEPRSCRDALGRRCEWNRGLQHWELVL